MFCIIDLVILEMFPQKRLQWSSVLVTLLAANTKPFSLLGMFSKEYPQIFRTLKQLLKDVVNST